MIKLSTHLSLWHSVVEWMRILCGPENYVFDTIISVALSYPLPITGARGAHKR